MQLVTLKGLLDTQEEMTRASQGSEDRAVIANIRVYFNDRTDSDELSAADIYHLLTFIPPDNRSVFFAAIKAEYDQHHLFDIYAALTAAAVTVSKDDFCELYELGESARCFLYRLLCEVQSKVETVNEEIWGSLFSIAIESEQKAYDLLALEKCMQLRRQYYFPPGLPFVIYMKAQYGIQLFTVLELYGKVACLYGNITHFGIFKNEFDIIPAFINKLLAANITMTPRLNRVIVQKANAMFFHFRTNIEKVYAVWDQYSSVLPKEVTLDDRFVMMLLGDEKKCIAFLTLVTHLKQENVLDNELWDACLRVHEQHDDSSLLISNKLAAHLVMLKQATLSITKALLLSVLAMPPVKLTAFLQVISHLFQCELLTETSLQQVLARIEERLPPVAKSHIVKKSRKVTHLERSEVLLDGNYGFFADHSQQYAKGAFGVVKKGYATVDSLEPTYAIKKIIESGREHYPSDADLKKEAVREVTRNRLLGRPSDYFSKPFHSPYRPYNYYVIAPWHSGENLGKCTAAALMQASYETRLQCLCQALLQLDTLHAHHRIHGDVKPSNVIIDLTLAFMKLCDFSGSIKFGSRHQASYTEFFSEGSRDPNHFYSDMYCMGVVVALLFPELYQDNWRGRQSFYFNERIAFTLLKESNVTLIEQAIIKLVDSMMNPIAAARCTSESAYRYCQALVANLTHLDEAILQQITNTTINNPNITVEDVLRERSVVPM